MPNSGTIAANMLPRISTVQYVELIRDGGSLWAVFAAEDGLTYLLAFRIRMTHISEDIVERSGFEPPVLSRYILIREDDRFYHRREDPTRLSWPEAEVLLQAMRPLLVQEAHREPLDAMLYTARYYGALPPGMERTLKTVRLAPKAAS